MYASPMTTTQVPTAETAIKGIIAVMLDSIDAAMARWNCTPEQAVAALRTLQAADIAE